MSGQFGTADLKSAYWGDDPVKKLYVGDDLLWSSEFTPASIPGLGLWLDASTITGLSPGDPVTTWPDASGLGRHATPVLTAPIYHSTSFNGHPAVYFGGTSRRLLIPGLGTALTGKTQYTVFYVAKVASFGYGVIISAPPNTVWRWLIEYEPSGSIYWGHGAGYRQYASGHLASNTSYIQTFHYTADDPRYYLNGTEVAVATYGGGGDMQDDVPNVDGDGLLGSYYDGQYPVDGVIAEVIWYDHALTTEERLAVEAYLASKWSITGAARPTGPQQLPAPPPLPPHLK
jgi:hypothetical protein